MLGGGDFSVSADKKKNTTAWGLTKNTHDPLRRDYSQTGQTGTTRPQSGLSPYLRYILFGDVLELFGLIDRYISIAKIIIISISIDGQNFLLLEVKIFDFSKSCDFTSKRYIKFGFVFLYS